MIGSPDIDLTPGRRRSRHPTRAQRQAHAAPDAPLGAGAHASRLVEMTARLLLGETLTHQGIRLRYGVSKPTASRDLRALALVLADLPELAMEWDQEAGALWSRARRISGV
jgi:hypothetical protein